MKRSENGRYPLCAFLVRSYRELSRDEQSAPATTPDERINSVWPFLIKKAARFVESLKDRQRTNYDLEDVLGDLYVELRVKDAKFDPAKATYITYASTLAEHLFVAIRDTSRTVHSPKNSGSRLLGYEQSRAAGTIHAGSEVTESKIRKTRCDFGDMDDAVVESPSKPDHEAEVSEEKRLAGDAVMAALASLTPYEAAVTGSRFGLWGQTAKPSSEVAESLGGSREQVNAALSSAKSKMRTRLESIRHAVVNME